VLLARNRVHAMDHPLQYARRILVNLALDGAELRSRHKGELDTADADLDDQSDGRSESTVRGIDDLAEFNWALTKLSPRQRAVLVLRYVDDLSEVEVAQVLDCSLGTVKSTASRGMARLRGVLQHGSPTSGGKMTPIADDRRKPC
jgi:RNA polymerase sigma factor (sigma-70 family)